MSSLGVVLSLPSIDDTVAAARLAERAGLDSVWTTEFPDRSATISLAAVAAGDRAGHLGSAIAYAFGRTPLVLAAEARDLDDLSGGRLILGLGTGTPKMQRDWHGLDGEHSAGANGGARAADTAPVAAARGPARARRALLPHGRAPHRPGPAAGASRLADLHGRGQPPHGGGGRRCRRTVSSAIRCSRPSTRARSYGRRSHAAPSGQAARLRCRSPAT